MAKGLARSEADLAWDCRALWARQVVVIATLDKQCMVPRIVGRISRVAVTGAFVVIEGWHVPMANVLSVSKATIRQQQEWEDDEAMKAFMAGEC